jgi:hypothetical protein
MNLDCKSLYIESTIPSYATARPSSDVVIAGRQILTRQFWDEELHKYDPCISQDVLDECSNGDPAAAKQRLDLLQGIRILPKTEDITTLAVDYQKLLKIPDHAKADCIHIATCVKWHIDYLLTWNFAHMGINTYIKLRKYNDQHGLWTPVLINPEDILPEQEVNI